MSRNEIRAQCRLRFQYPQCGDGHGQDRRLSMLSELEIRFRTVEAEFAQRKTKRLIGLVKNSLRHRQLRAQLLPHADDLGALTGKNKRNCPAFRHRARSFLLDPASYFSPNVSIFDLSRRHILPGKPSPVSPPISPRISTIWRLTSCSTSSLAARIAFLIARGLEPP